MTKKAYMDVIRKKLTYERIKSLNGKGAMGNHKCWLWRPGEGPKGYMREQSCLVCFFCRNGEMLLCPMADVCGPWEGWQSQLDKESEKKLASGVPSHLYFHFHITVFSKNLLINQIKIKVFKHLECT